MSPPLSGTDGSEQLLAGRGVGPAQATTARQSRTALIAALLVPLVILGALIVYLLRGGANVFPPPPAPIEKVAIERMVLREGEIVVRVRNTGPDPVTIAQVAVDEAVWPFRMTPEGTLGRMVKATITIPFHWIPGEPVEVKLISSSGVAFKKAVEVAALTPVPSLRYFGTFALLGTYVGVIPVFLGLLWLPLLRRLSRRWFSALLSFTAGLLVFLGVDTVKEGLEAAGKLPGVFHGVGLLTIALSASFLGLLVLGARLQRAGAAKDETYGRLALAYLIAAGIGLHNLGEGLAIGAAYTLGEVALGALLIIGFTIHNTTEGPAIIAPISRDRPGLRHLVLLGIIGGVPTIAGAWIGGFVYSLVWAVVFLGLGAGAIFQVVLEVGRLMARTGAGTGLTVEDLLGFMAGLLLMYLTGLLVPS